MTRCTIARLMKNMGLTGVLRGKKIRTIVSRKEAAAGDWVNRQFVTERPNQLWVADFTYMSTWQGFTYVAFIIDVFADRDRELAGLIADENYVRAGCAGGPSPFRHYPSLG